MSARTTDVLRRASAYLERHGVESPGATAEILLMHTLGTDRAGLFARRDGLSPDEAKRFGRALCRRCAGTPVQHLTGEQAFRALVLEVRRGVFVPRPETEVVVEHALAAVDGVTAPVVVDVGTGSGAIALAVADARRDARVIATDVSGDAVALARANAERLGLAVEVLRGDALSPLPAELRRRVDLVVSNPPYVEPDEWDALPPDVRADPRGAILGGLAVVERFAADAATWLRPGGGLVMEIGASQGAAARSALGEPYTEARVEVDLAGRDRVLVARVR